MADKSSSDEFMSFDDELESAYREALQRMDDAEWQIAQAFTELQQDAGSEEPASDQGTFEDGLNNDSNEQVQDHAGTIEQTAAELLAEDREVSESGQPDDIRLHPRQIVEASIYVVHEVLHDVIFDCFRYVKLARSVELIVFIIAPTCFIEAYYLNVGS